MVRVGLNGSFDAQLAKHPSPFDPIIWPLSALFFGLALGGTLEITLQVLTMFRRWSGLYFWSILITAWAVTLHNITWALHIYTDTNWIAFNTLESFAWWAMQMGMGVVLYSRLHLVISDPKWFRIFQIVLIADFFLLCVPNTVNVFLYANPNITPAEYTRRVKAFLITDRLQVIGFTLQDGILSAIYVPFANQLLRPIMGKRVKKIIRPLIIVLALTIFLDLVQITMEFSGLLALKCIIQGFFVTIKLRIEFMVLNQLLTVTHAHVPSPHNLPRLKDDELTMEDSPDNPKTRSNSDGDSTRKRDMQPVALSPQTFHWH